MEELISRYFFIAIVIFATILDLVGRWHKNRQRGAGRPGGAERHELRVRQDLHPRQELREIEWEREQLEALERERAEAQVSRRPEPSRERMLTVDLPGLADIFLEEVTPPIPWMDIRRPAAIPPRPAPERPMQARVVPAPRPAGARSAVQSARPAAPPRVRRRLRASLADPAAARRAIILAEILGPCRGLEPIGRRR